MLFILLAGLLSVDASHAQIGSQSPAQQITLRAEESRILHRAWQAMDNNNIEEVLDALAKLGTNSRRNGLLIAEIGLLQSRLWLESRLDKSAAKLDEVLAWLADSEGHFRMNDRLRQKLFETSVLVYQATNKPLKLAQAWMKAIAWLPNSEQKNAVNQIWHALQSTPYHLLTEQLALAAEKAEPNLEMQSWYQLAQLTYYALLPSQQYQAWLSWQKTWPQHIAAIQPPAPLKDLPRVIERQPKNIAVLLPLSGPRGKAGQAVQDGLISAYFLTIASDKTAFSFFDTAKEDLRTIYSRALNEGAKMIIGPLEKEKLTELVRFAKGEVPVLALNYLPKETRLSHLPRFYQLDLAPHSEQSQLIQRAITEAGKRSIIIHSADEWGVQNADIIAQSWRQLGGQVIDQVAVESPKDAVDQIGRVLHVDLSTQRAKQVRQLIGVPMEFQARRRQDIDLVLLVANRDISNAVNPALAYHLAGDLPVYSLNRVIPKGDQAYPDLNGILYCDLPWRIYGHSLKPLLERLRPASTVFYGLFALGVDVAGLSARLSQFEQDRDMQFNGATGRLSLQKSGRFHRQLAWAQVTNGFSIPLDTLASGDL